jgi:hypothetical protein
MTLDPRGPRLAAGLTSVVLILVLVTGSGWLMLAQALIFAVGTYDPRRTPWGLLYRYLLAPRLAPPVEREDAAPVRFAQAVGLGFAVISALGYLLDVQVLGIVAAAFALIAAFLNAAFGLCLGCAANIHRMSDIIRLVNDQWRRRTT